MNKIDIQSVLDKVIAWRDESDNHTVFCLFGEQNCEDGYLYSSSVGGCQRTIAHMVYTEMKKDPCVAEAVKKAVEVYNKKNNHNNGQK